jgi:two-component system OmpR family response regulator
VARAVLAAQPFDFIVLDVALETEDGLEFCRQVRAESKAPILLLSDSGSRPAVANALRSGADCILVKPLMEDIFLLRIHGILESAPAGAAGLESPHEQPLEPV